MRRPLPFLLLALLATCHKFDNPYDPANNHPPLAPSDPSPAEGADRQDTLGLVLRWSCSDPDTAVGDTLTFDVFFGSESIPLAADSGLSERSWSPGVLGVGATYYWQVRARDARGGTSSGPVWSFSTSFNRPPGVPSGPDPLDGASGMPATVTLRWKGGDPNPGDSVTYDVYLGRTTPPPLVVSGLRVSQMSVTGLEYSAPYYWRVVARDLDSVETEGPVWQFLTMSRVTFASPAGGEAWRVGTMHLVRWSGGSFQLSGRAITDVNFLGPDADRKRVGTGIDAADSTVFWRSADSGQTWSRVGRATQAGQFSWTVDGPASRGAFAQVRIHAGTQVEMASSPGFMTYTSPSPITVTEPAAGARWGVGTSRTVHWEGGTDWVDSTVIHYSTNNGRTWWRQGRATAPGVFEWTVPPPVTDSARVRVKAYVVDTLQAGVSSLFVVCSSLVVTVTEPNDSTRWRANTIQTVRWLEADRHSDSAVVWYRPDTSISWQRQGVSTGSSYNWTVPSPATDRAQVRVEAWQSGSGASGTSPAFSIYDTAAPSQPVVTSPAGGENWGIGTEHELTWIGGTYGMDSTVVRYSTDDGSTWLRQGRTKVPGSFHWTVPGPASNQARIGVVAWCLGRSSEGVSAQFRTSGGSYPDTVVATVAVGDRPIAACFNERANKLYVANRSTGTVSVIDGDDNSVVATIAVGSFPSALACDSVHNRVYCSNEGSRTVTVIDGAGDSAVATVGVGAAPRDICVNPVSRKVYVVNGGTGANSVTIIDAASGSVLATVPCGERPRALAWNPVNNRVYVACYAGNAVTVIDGSSNAVLDSVVVGWSPCAVVVVEDLNQVYVANSGSASNSVSVINAANNTVIEHVQVGTGPGALAWNSTAGKVYVCNDGASSVSVIRTSNRQVAAVIGVGTQPAAVTWFPAYNMTYVACRGSDQVAILNGSSDSREKTLTVGDEPVALARNSGSGKVYAAEYGGDTVSVIASP